MDNRCKLAFARGMWGAVVSGRSMLGRVVAPTVAVAVVTSALAVVVNLATEWKTNPWAWVGVAGLTLAAAGGSWWMFRSQSSATASDAPPPGQSVTNSTISGPNIQIGSAGGNVEIHRSDDGTP
jgi:hypothetical protein